jgi:hypothetical protein
VGFSCRVVDCISNGTSVIPCYLRVIQYPELIENACGSPMIIHYSPAKPVPPQITQVNLHIKNFPSLNNNLSVASLQTILREVPCPPGELLENREQFFPSLILTTNFVLKSNKRMILLDNN